MELVKIASLRRQPVAAPAIPLPQAHAGGSRAAGAGRPRSEAAADGRRAVDRRGFAQRRAGGGAEPWSASAAARAVGGGEQRRLRGAAARPRRRARTARRGRSVRRRCMGRARRGAWRAPRATRRASRWWLSRDSLLGSRDNTGRAAGGGQAMMKSPAMPVRGGESRAPAS
jgi:hypothetical protein